MSEKKSGLAVSVLLALLAAIALVSAPALAQPPAFPGAKTLDSGADPIATGKNAATIYQYTITLNANNFSNTDDLLDTAPAEFDVTSLTPSCGTAEAIVKLQRKPTCKMQPDHIVWDLDGCDTTSSQTLIVVMQTDENPGHCRKGIDFYEPTSCGPLSLNDGAILYDPVTELETSDISNSLQVAACDVDVDALCETNDTDTDDDGWAVTCGDCNDADGAVNPDAEEVCNGVDDNCDGQIDEGLSCV